MTLPARLLWGVKLHENVLHVIHFDVCFDKSWYRKLSFSYRNNHNSIAVTQYACYMWVSETGHAHASTKKF